LAADTGGLAGEAELLGEANRLAVAAGEDFDPVGGGVHIYVRIYKRPGKAMGEVIQWFSRSEGDE
jgi:hypothetical protein